MPVIWNFTVLPSCSASGFTLSFSSLHLRIQPIPSSKPVSRETQTHIFESVLEGHIHLFLSCFFSYQADFHLLNIADINFNRLHIFIYISQSTASTFMRFNIIVPYFNWRNKHIPIDMVFCPIDKIPLPSCRIREFTVYIYSVA